MQASRETTWHFKWRAKWQKNGCTTLQGNLFQGMSFQGMSYQGMFFTRNVFSKECHFKECFFQGMPFPRNFYLFLYIIKNWFVNKSLYLFPLHFDRFLIFSHKSFNYPDKHNVCFRNVLGMIFENSFVKRP